MPCGRQESRESLPGGMLLTTPPATAPPVTEPRYGATFGRAVHVYAPRADFRGPRLSLTIAVHYQEDADREAALRSARLAARLLRLFRERFGRDVTFPRDAPAAHVYRMPPRANAAGIGGETHGHEVYLYLAGVARTPLEQVRTLAHEWGHLTLPAARGYSDPETDASGYLGERLYMKWLRETGADAKDGTDAPGLALYYERQVAPLLTRFARGGPASKEMDGGGTAGMDYYIAGALAFEQAVGPRLLGRALFTIAGEGPRDLLPAMADALARQTLVNVRIGGGAAWLPLPAARYAVTSDAPGVVTFGDAGTLRVRPDRPATLAPRRAGWRKVRVVSGPVRRLTLRRAGSGKASE